MKYVSLLFILLLHFSTGAQIKNEVSIFYSRAVSTNFDRNGITPGLSHQYSLDHVVGINDRWSWQGGLGGSRLFTSFYNRYGHYRNFNPGAFCGFTGCNYNDVPKKEIFDFGDVEDYDRVILTHFTIQSQIRYRILSLGRIDWLMSTSFFGWYEKQDAKNSRDIYDLDIERNLFLFGW